MLQGVPFDYKRCNLAETSASWLGGVCCGPTCPLGSRGAPSLEEVPLHLKRWPLASMDAPVVVQQVSLQSNRCPSTGRGMLLKWGHLSTIGDSSLQEVPAGFKRCAFTSTSPPEVPVDLNKCTCLQQVPLASRGDALLEKVPLGSMRCPLGFKRCPFASRGAL